MRVENMIVRPVSVNLTTVRRLHSIEYRVFEDPDDIHDFINVEVRKELEADLESMGQDPRDDALIHSLPKRKWKLEVVNINDVRLNPLILNSSDIKTGRKFAERLKERRSELRKALEARKEVIWPIVLAHEDHLLIDGHCRYSALKEMSIPEICCYVGRVVTH